MKSNKGFSLVELIVVIAIMAILAAVAIPTFAHFINKANNAADAQFYADVVYAIDLANAKFDVSAGTVDIDVADGKAKEIIYAIGTGHTITIDAAAGTATCTCDAAGTCEYAKAANDVNTIIDLDAYQIKSSTLVSGFTAYVAPTTPGAGGEGGEGGEGD